MNEIKNAEKKGIIKGIAIIALSLIIVWQVMVNINYVKLSKYEMTRAKLANSLKYELEHNVRTGEDLQRIINQYFYNKLPKTETAKPIVDTTKTK
jgi:hypothetical protein